MRSWPGAWPRRASRSWSWRPGRRPVAPGPTTSPTSPRCSPPPRRSPTRAGPTAPAAPSPSVLDIRPLTPGGPPGTAGYFVQEGPQPFGSDYQRSRGGTTLHWYGHCIRMLPSDFAMRSTYGVGVDWPLDLRRARPVVRRGGARDRCGGRRRGPGAHRPDLPAGLRVPDAQDPADLPRPVDDRASRRDARADRPGHLHDRRGAGARWTELDAQPGVRRRPGVPTGRRGRATDLRAAVRGQLELHPRMPRAGQVQRAEDARGGRRSRSPRDHAGRGQQGAGRRRPPGLRRRVPPVDRRHVPDRRAAHDHRASLRAGRPLGGERQAAADVGRGQHQRPGRPQPDGPPVPAQLGPHRRAARDLPRSRYDGRHRDPAGRALPRAALVVPDRHRQLGLPDPRLAGLRRRRRRLRRPAVRHGAARARRPRRPAPADARLPARAAARPRQPGHHPAHRPTATPWGSRGR